MKIFHSSRISLLLLGASLLTVRLVAGPWESLFNGKDLTGWEVINGRAPYTVIDGAIVGTTIADSPNSFLATKKTYGDFIFECDVLQEGKSNSGVQFRGLSRPDYLNGRVHGYQFEIDSSPRAWTGGVYDESRRGWLYPVHSNPSARSAYQFGRWNRLRIEAIGPVIRTWINGIAVSHLVDDMTPAGFLALQIHSISKPEDAGCRVYWRNLRIQTTDLQPSPVDKIFIRSTIPNQVSEAEKAQGWRLLWDGQTSAGWRGKKAAGFPATGWSIEKGVLSVLGTKGGDIVTEEEFSAFELQLEAQLTEGANSGVKYLFAEDAEKSGALEYQLLDDERHEDAKKGAAGNRTLGSLYDLIPRGPLPPGLAIAPRVGEWQHVRIVVTANNRVEHWLNGAKVVEFERGSPLFAALVERSKFVGIPEFGLAKKGRILLQDHGDVVRFRSIKIRSLAAE